jgi:hypothetical protein
MPLSRSLISSLTALGADFCSSKGETMKLFYYSFRKGNDSNTGSKFFPFKTLKRLLGAAAALLFFVGTLPAQATGPTFYYVVTTVDTTGLESVFSNQVSAILTQGKHIDTLTWTASTVVTGGNPIAGYNVYRGTVSGGPYTKINTALVTSVTYSDTFVPPNAPSGLTVVTQ